MCELSAIDAQVQNLKASKPSKDDLKKNMNELNQNFDEEKCDDILEKYSIVEKKIDQISEVENNDDNTNQSEPVTVVNNKYA